MRTESLSVKNIRNLLKLVPWPFVGAGTLSAALLVLSFPPYLAWGLAFVGMVPFLLALFRARSHWDAFWIGFPCMVFFILFGFGWISFVATNFGGLPWIVGKLVLLLFALFAEAQYLIFALAAFSILQLIRARGKAGWGVSALWLVALPIAYVGMDFLYPKIFPSAFGHVLYGWFSVAQLAEYTGVYVLSLPIVWVNMALAVLLHKATTRERLSSPAMAVALIAAVGVGLLAADRWGTRRIAELKELDKGYTKSLKFSLIQANIGDMDKLASEGGFEPAVQKVLSTYREMSKEAIAKYKPDLIVWPETAFPFLFTHLQDDLANRTGQARDAWMYALMREIDTPLYFGTYSAIDNRDYNSAFLLEPPFRQTAVYRKSILLAFGEYVPLGPLSPLIQTLIPTIANFGRGPGPVALDFKGVKLGPQICYEGIYPEHPRGAVRAGADILLNITNDSWFGDTTEPWLHLALTAFRSIELRRPLVRATNTGISTIIDTTGEMRYRTRLFEKETLNAEVKAPGPDQAAPVTFYIKHGEILAQVCALFALAALVPLAANAYKGRVARRLRKTR